MLTRTYLQQVAEKVKLELIGLVTLGPEERFPHFLRWLEEGKHAEMHYLEQHSHCRQDPRLLAEGAKSAIILGLPYFQGDSWPALKKYHDHSEQAQPSIAQYARFQDYHKLLKRKCELFWQTLLGHPALQANPSLSARITVDSAPLLERALAARSQAGFIGKNTLYIHPQKGSFFLLGEVLSPLELAADQPSELNPAARSPDGGCGSCRRCQVYCPTGALDEAYRLDARRCLSYYTIEHRGPIPLAYWPWLRYYLFGCDICQLVCPYNRKLEKQDLSPWQKGREEPTLFAIATMNQEQYESWFGGTPLTRAKRAGLKRNALIAMVVTKHPQLEEACLTLKEEGLPLLLDTMAQIPAYQEAGSSISITCKEALSPA